MDQMIQNAEVVLEEEDEAWTEPPETELGAIYADETEARKSVC